jgi:hypothetical protein
MFCSNCGAKLSVGAHFCDTCGTAVLSSGPEAYGAPRQASGFSSNDVLATAGVAAPLLSRGAGGDIAGYMMSKAALSNLEEHGQGDSAMADMARTGMAISQFKIVAGIIGFVVFLIVALVMYSNFQHQQAQFNQQFNGGLGNTGCTVTSPGQTCTP